MWKAESFGEIEQRMPAIGYEIMVLVFYHAPIWQVVLSTGCIVRTSIALRFIGRFQRGFQCIFSCALHSSYFIC